MRYHTISVGSELTLGLSVNTNAPFISQKLGEIGFSCVTQKAVPDDIKLISQSISESFKDVDLVVLTGGLGPTSDDITREAICEATACELEYRAELAAIIDERFGSRIGSLPQVAYRQAYLPSGAQPIIPTIGSAPGIILAKEGKYVVALPGVPREMKAMIEQDVVPWLTATLASGEYFKLRVIRTTVKSEGVLQETINDIIESLEHVIVGIIASPGEIQLQLVARADDETVAEERVAKAQELFKERLGDQIYGYDDETLESVVGDMLRKRGLTLSVAESCTGGLIAKRLTDIPGSSEYFVGAIVSYSNSVKEMSLGIPEQVIQEKGAVSEETAVLMAKGVRECLKSDIAISVTGIAGPEGGSDEKPVGLVYIGLAAEDTTLFHRFVFFGSRNIVRGKSASASLDMLRHYLLELGTRHEREAF